MDEKINHNTAEIKGKVSPEITARIYLERPSPNDRKVVHEKKEEIINVGDPGGVELNKHLRDSLSGKSIGENGDVIHELALDLDTEIGWNTTVELARSELLSMSPDSLAKVLSELAAYVKCLPAGHSKGHILRDIVYLNAIFQDPELLNRKIDEVELIVGIFAAVFHDSSGAVSNRYEDVNRVATHAEISAVLFANVAQELELIPHNLTRLIQYAIAAHTHYLNPRDVQLELPDATKITATQQVYTDDVVNGSRRSMWLTRQSDRSDTANFGHTIRDLIVRAEPIQDHDGESFEEKKERQESFLSAYGLTSGQVIIKHESMFARSVFTDNPYTSQDSKYYTEVVRTPGVGDLLLLFAVISPDKKDELLAEIGSINPEVAARLRLDLDHHSEQIQSTLDRTIGETEMSQSLEIFKDMCRTIEPAEDLEHQLASFEELFPLLPEKDRIAWAKGFIFMSEVLMNRWMSRLAESAATDPHLGHKITSQDSAMQQLVEGFGSNLQAMAQEFLAAMNQATVA